ncbi:DUF3114 domain-containing protein [Streptococcus cuniculipharyngis]|uniref:DUF3114 domain-containing protein n=2 Tax=Streptococcus cuniculipharyngis TaxID=1562651 RepID=A0A5C5SE61_9STRE|nr:DUF3114 domain-containing protein [Streptococcus cuniculipharyngis]
MTGQQGDFTEQSLRARYQLARQLLTLLAKGWSKASLRAVLGQHLAVRDTRVGTEAFKAMWRVEKKQSSPQQLLQILLNHLDFPQDLSGQLSENQALVRRFWPHLAPHDGFWRELARLVNRTFPQEALCQPGLLARQIHQLRYLISSQQAAYVREHYGQEGQTDAKALARYLRKTFAYRPFAYSTRSSARLHNKVKFRKGEKIYPSAYPSVNIKVLVGFHTEFILDSQGNFLNELETKEVTEIGIVNGASFNYGKGQRHWHLDVNPVAIHDPVFRQMALKGFRAPNRQGKKAPTYEKSYFNPSGLYAKNNQSAHQQNKEAVKAFRRLVRQF